MNNIVSSEQSVFYDHWKDKGHIFGTCMSSPDNDLMYVNIPKCASSWTKPNLKDLGWEFYNYHYDHLKNKHAMVVLRDPVERWVSGIAEYMVLYHSEIDTSQFNDTLFEIMVDRVTFDDHTEKQVYFLEGLNLNKCTFFYCNQYYRQGFTQFLRNQGTFNVADYSTYNYQHTTDSDAYRTKFRDIFKPLLKVPKYVDHIKAHYKKDYELIQKVSFFTTHDQRKI
jgi:hypothetical protein